VSPSGWSNISHNTKLALSCFIPPDLTTVCRWLPLEKILFVGSLGYRSNFVVGLTNTHPVLHAPVLWNYTLCGQYPGSVPDGATATVYCTNAFDRGLRFRYVIVQFPLINDTMNFCEIEVFTVGEPLYYIVSIKRNYNT